MSYHGFLLSLAASNNCSQKVPQECCHFIPINFCGHIQVSLDQTPPIVSLVLFCFVLVEFTIDFDTLFKARIST